MDTFNPYTPPPFSAGPPTGPFSNQLLKTLCIASIGTVLLPAIALPAMVGPALGETVSVISIVAGACVGAFLSCIGAGPIA